MPVDTATHRISPQNRKRFIVLYLDAIIFYCILYMLYQDMPYAFFLIKPFDNRDNLYSLCLYPVFSRVFIILHI